MCRCKACNAKLELRESDWDEELECFQDVCDNCQTKALEAQGNYNHQHEQLGDIDHIISKYSSISTNKFDTVADFMV